MQIKSKLELRHRTINFVNKTYFIAGFQVMLNVLERKCILLKVSIWPKDFL